MARSRPPTVAHGLRCTFTGLLPQCHPYCCSKIDSFRDDSQKTAQIPKQVKRNPAVRSPSFSRGGSSEQYGPIGNPRNVDHSKRNRCMPSAKATCIAVSTSRMTMWDTDLSGIAQLASVAWELELEPRYHITDSRFSC